MYVAFSPPRLDGLASAAILLRHTRLRQKELRLHFTNDFIRHSVIFMLDMVPSSREYIEKLASHNKIAYWCYHQKTMFDDEVRKVSAQTDLLPGPLKCSAELVQERFMLRDTISISIARIARDFELWQQHDERAQKLSDVIASGFNPRELVAMLSRGVFWSPILERARNEYIKKRDVAMHDMLHHRIDKSYVNFSCAFYFCRNILQSAEAGERALDNSKADFVVLLYRDGRVIFRRGNNSTVNMAKLAKLFHGGGNAFAAGAHLQKQITKDSLPDAIWHIDEQLKNYFFQ